jgi:hypothetical protein
MSVDKRAISDDCIDRGVQWMEKHRYSWQERSRRISNLDIEEAEPQYTKAQLLLELERRNRRISRRSLSRRLSYDIDIGLIEPPVRQEGKRGRPGLYNGSVVIVEELLAFFLQKARFPFIHGEVKTELAKLRLEAARQCGYSKAPTPLPIVIDKVYADLIRRAAPTIYGRLHLLGKQRQDYMAASRALAYFIASLRDLKNTDEDFFKSFLEEHSGGISELCKMIGITRSKE